jgi:hypothetical protein
MRLSLQAVKRPLPQLRANQQAPLPPTEAPPLLKAVHGPATAATQPNAAHFNADDLLLPGQAALAAWIQQVGLRRTPSMHSMHSTHSMFGWSNKSACVLAPAPACKNTHMPPACMLHIACMPEVHGHPPKATRREQLLASSMGGAATRRGGAGGGAASEARAAQEGGLAAGWRVGRRLALAPTARSCVRDARVLRHLATRRARAKGMRFCKAQGAPGGC